MAVEPSSILVVDDEMEMRERIREILTREGHRVVVKATASWGQTRVRPRGS